MAEYRMVKCAMCGNERQGARLMRIKPEHKPEWSALEKQEKKSNRRVGISLIANILIPLTVMIFAFLQHPSSKSPDELGMAFAVAFPTMMASYAIIWFCVSYPLLRRDRELRKSKMDFLRKHYGECAQYEIVEEEPR